MPGSYDEEIIGPPPIGGGLLTRLKKYISKI